MRVVRRFVNLPQIGNLREVGGSKKKGSPQAALLLSLSISRLIYFCLSTACAAANRAMGTRKGEQDT